MWVKAAPGTGGVKIPKLVQNTTKARISCGMRSRTIEAGTDGWRSGFGVSFGDQRTRMGALSLRLPDSLHRKLREVAEREGVSINQWISSAVAEKMSALLTEEYLQARAKRGSRKKFEAVLAKIPDVEPDESDRMPRPRRGARRKNAG